MKSYKFCPYCGSSVKKYKSHIKCNSCKKMVYFNSIPTVGVLIIKNGKVLLSKRKIAPKKNYWDYPGGFTNKGEHPKSAAKREILEETGLKIKIIDFLGIYINKDYEYQNEKIYPQDTIYIAEIRSGKPVAKDDISEIKWFSIKTPPKKIAFGSVKEALKDLKKWYQDYNI